jgi:hypothetical protein
MPDPYDELLNGLAPTSKRIKPTTPHLDLLTNFAKENNLTVGSTTGGRHNTGSLHYSGNAIDIKGSGAFDDATVQRLSQAASSRGLKLRDERVKPPNQKVWGGPHVHIEYAGQGDQYDSLLDGLTETQQPESSTPAQKPVQPKPRKPASPFAGVLAGAEGVKGDLMGSGASAAKVQPGLGEQLRAASRMAGSMTGADAVLPASAQDALGEQLAKGGAGLLRTASGVVKVAPRVGTLGIPTPHEGILTAPIRNPLNRAADTLEQAAGEAAQQSGRGGVAQTIEDVGGGAIASSPAMILQGLGVPAPVAFGVDAYLKAEGRDADWKTILKETGLGAASGALFEIPTPIKSRLAGQILQKLAIVGVPTTAMELAAGKPLGQAITSGAVQGGFAASGARAKEGIAEPIQTVPEPLQSRVRMGDIRDQAAQQGAELLNPAEVVAGQKPKVRLNATQTEAQPNITAQPESAQSADRGIAESSQAGVGIRDNPTGKPTAVPESTAGTEIVDRGSAYGQDEPPTLGDKRDGVIIARKPAASSGGVFVPEGKPSGLLDAPVGRIYDGTPTSYVRTFLADIPQPVLDKLSTAPENLRSVIGGNIPVRKFIDQALEGLPKAEVDKVKSNLHAARTAWKDGDDAYQNMWKAIDDLVAERRVSPQSETKVEPTERIQPNETQAQSRISAKPEISEPQAPERSQSAVENVPRTQAGMDTQAREGVPEATSARKSQLDQDRSELDLPELPQAERKSWQASLANAKPERAGLLADEVLNKPRSLNDEETASLVVRAQEIKNEHAQTMKEIGASSDPETIAARKSQADALEREFDKITRATKASGTEKGRTLAAQKLTINKDYDLISMVQRAKAAKGRELTAGERGRYEKMASQIEDLNKQLSDANEKAQKAQLQRSIDKVKRQTRRQETKAVLDGEFASLKSQLAQAKLETRSGVQGSLLAGLDPEGKLTPIIARMAKNRVKSGINSAEGLVDEVFSAVKDHYDVSREDVARVIRGTLHQPDDVLSKWDKRRQSQLLKQQSGIESRLATGDFSPKPSRETPIYNRETFRLQRQVNELKAKYDRELYRATRGTTGKLIDTAAGFGNIPKTMLSMADISAVLRQGGIGVYQHPILSSKAGVDMLKSFTSHGFANAENAIKNSPRFDQAKRAGVEFTGVDKDNPQLSKHEEGYLGSGAIDTLAKGQLNPLRVVKGVKDFSERTFVSFLDSQRMRIFENQAKALEDMGLKGRELDNALKSQAKYINIITGRGSLGVKGNQAAPALNVAMFSPRLIASRFQFLNKMANPVAWANMPKGARKLQMIDNAKFLFGVASTLALAKAAGANVSLDPDDSEFLKIKAGNTRYDMLAGLQQPMRFMYRMTRAIKGGETYEGEDKGKIVADFARSKAAPLAGYAVDYLEGRNRLSGKKFEAGKDLVGNVIPLPFQDFRDAIKEDGAARGIAEAFPTLFGVGTQTYPSPLEKASTKAEKLTRKLIADKMPDESRTQEEIDKDQKLSELRVQARRGIDVTKALEALKSQGTINDKTEKSILSARGQTRLQEGFKRLGLKEALTVYSTMTPVEQNSVKKILGEKAITVDTLPLDDQKPVRDKLQDYGFKPGMQIPKRPTIQRPERPNPRAWSAP